MNTEMAKIFAGSADSTALARRGPMSAAFGCSAALRAARWFAPERQKPLPLGVTCGPRLRRTACASGRPGRARRASRDTVLRGRMVARVKLNVHSPKLFGAPASPVDIGLRPMLMVGALGFLKAMVVTDRPSAG